MTFRKERHMQEAEGQDARTNFDGRLIFMGDMPHGFAGSKRLSQQRIGYR